MRSLKFFLFSFAAIVAMVVNADAQQDPQYSQYMFNQMAINPAYAGSKDALSAAALFRTQWTNIDGAPQTETFTIHGPVVKQKMGLGLTIIGDQIGPKKSIGALGSYAYRIPIKNGKLAFGLRFGVYQFTYNWADINYKDQTDPYNTQNKTSKIVPTADAGLYYNTNTMYLGFSATHLYNGRLTDNVSGSTGDGAKFSAHYFFTFGKAWSFSDKLVFNPSIVVKAAKNSPATGDLNLCFQFDQKIWVGVSIRSSYGLVALTQFNITDKLKFGYSFDFGMNKIGRVGGGTHEIMIAYDFNIYKSKMMSPRYL